MPRDNSNRVTSRCILSRIDVCMRIVSSVAREIIFLYVYLFVHFLMFAEYKRRQPSLSDGSKQLSVGKLVRIKANDIVIKADGSQYSESAEIDSFLPGMTRKALTHRSVLYIITYRP